MTDRTPAGPIGHDVEGATERDMRPTYVRVAIVWVLVLTVLFLFSRYFS